MEKNTLRICKMDKYIEGLGQISFVMLVLYFLDIILMGTGAISKIGGVSARILYFALAGVFSIPLLLRDLRKMLHNSFIICMIVFMMWLVFSGVRGIQNGNNKGIITTDFLGYLNFCILPTAVCVLNNERRKRILLNVIVSSSLLMAAFTIVFSFLPFFPYPDEVYEYMEKTGIVSITVMNGNATRVFCHTGSRYFCVSFMIILASILNTNERKRIIIGILEMAALIIGIFLSYTRAIYAGCVVACMVFVIIAFVFWRGFAKKSCCFILLAGVVAVAGIGVLSMVQDVNLFKASLYRIGVFLDNGEDAFDNKEELSEIGGESISKFKDSFDYEMEEQKNLESRQIKMDLLNQSIMKNPIIGNGLGSAIAFEDGYVEYTYQDIVNKMGLIGLLLFVAPFLFEVCYVFFKKEKVKAQKRLTMDTAMLCSMVYFLFIAYFNPCMNTTVGISCYVLSMVTIGERTA